MSDIYRIIKDSTHEERSIPEGTYSCTCCDCGRTFTGWKRSVVCEVCKVNPPTLTGKVESGVSIIDPKASQSAAPDLRKAAQPVAEVVAHMRGDNIGMVMVRPTEYLLLGTKLYTAPPSREWQGFSYEEVEELQSGMTASHREVRAIEAALKEKNHG